MNIRTAFASWLFVLAGCTALQPRQAESPSIYLLEARVAAVEQPAKAPQDIVLAVSMPRARSGYDTARIAYVRQAHEIDYFTKSRWADTPPRMLAPLVTRALEAHGAFRTVAQSPSSVPADVRLDTELIRLQHDFAQHPSRVEIALRAQLVDLRTRRVSATAEFEETENAPDDDAYGGVIAANRALQRLLVRLADFCAESSGGQ